MRVPEFLKPERVHCDLKSTSKKRVLEALSELLATVDSHVTEASVLDALFARERLGSTCLGHGVALPHARMANVKEAIGAFVKLAEGIDFDATDGQPVDLVFGLLVPEKSANEHLEILSTLAARLSDEQMREKLRACGSSPEVWQLLAGAGTDS